jgi:DNA-binding transcriptional regulator YiaG
MITSDRQMKVSKEQLALLTSALAAEMSSRVPKKLIAVRQQKLHEDIAKMQAEIDEYEHLQNMSVKDIAIIDIDDLFKAPIRFRIANHMTVEQFAQAVGTSVRQIHRYEETEYTSSSIPNLKKILRKIDIHLNGRIGS